MSSSAREREVTISQTEVIVTQTEVSGNKDDLQKVLVNDINKVSKGVVKSLEGFRTFILRGNVVDLAIGIVIGAAFTAVVNALVSDIITPLIPVSKTSSLASWDISIPHTYVNLHIGAFINAVISFLIVAAVLYFFVVQPVNSLMKLYHGKETATPTTRDCPYCYQAVNIKATRCPYCTSRLFDGEIEEDKQPVLILPETLEALSDKLADRLAKRASVLAEPLNDTPAAGSTSAEKA